VLPRKPQLLLALALALCAGFVTPILGQEEPFEGLWERSARGDPVRDHFLYGMVLRYQARARLRAAGTLPEPFRAAEDTLGMRSDRYEDFLFLQDSLGLGPLPPLWARIKGARDLTKREVSVQIDSAVVEESVVLDGTPVQPSIRIPLASYLESMTRRNFRSLWVAQAQAGLQTTLTQKGGGGLVPELALPFEMPGAVRSVVGAGKPNLTVRGSERISFSGTSRWFPDRPVTEFQRQQSKFPQLDMKQELNLQLTGNIGDKVSVDVDQSSEAATPLSNRIKIHYKGYEDEIIQRVDLGNTSLSLPGTQYVSYGGKHEGLFGISTQALLGSVELTGILSKQEGKNDTRTLSSGSEVRTFTVEDWEYKKGKFFFLIDPEGPPLPVGDQVMDVEVWIDDRDGNNNSEQLTAPAYVTLSGDAALPESRASRATGDFNQLVPNQDFNVQLDVYPGYPVLILDDSQVLDGRMTKAMGVSFRTTSGLTIGGSRGGDPDSLVLKLLRPAAEMGGTNPLNLTAGIFADARRLELRNVYDLGSNLSPEGLLVRIRLKATRGGITNPDRLGELTFLQLTGLDLYTDAGETQTVGPDGRIDRGRINYESGYVMFCDLQPFAPLPSDADRCPDGRPSRLSGAFVAPDLYTRNDWSTVSVSDTISKFQFEATARTAVSRITLNAFNIIQGSEVVTAGGRPLNRDRDYTIDYDTGEIEILDAADVRDTDEIKVSYSYLPFGGGGQKTLIGSALRYRPQATKFDFSTTWVYESKGAPGIEGRRPRLGQEPTRTLVGELATAYKTDSWLLTNLVNDIPGIRTTARSNVSVDAGVGLSFPNPNVRGELYTDDFEGAKDVFSISMNRLSWRPSGIPIGAAGNGEFEKADRRGECWHYTPRAAVKEGDLQPTREQSGGLADTEKDNNRQVLELNFFPSGGTDAERRESWFSLVQPISQRGTDLSRAQFLDLWINDFRSATDTTEVRDREGILHLEIGVVSEDAIWQRVEPNPSGEIARGRFPTINRTFDTEDENRDGQLDDPGGGTGEDIGIDFLADPDEGSGPDPAYDNWAFEEKEDETHRDLARNPNTPEPDPPLLTDPRFSNFAKIDGTQGNGKLDTEDLNDNQILDQSEAYFSFSIDLSDKSLVEFESSQALDQDPKYAPFTRGWRRIRIPLTSKFAETVGTPGWEQVRHLRLWFEGFSHETVLQIGGIEITGNRWLKGTIRDAQGIEVPASELQARGEDFFPAVLNNKDNSTSEYNPPFAPREQQNVEEREQSLTLELRNFPPGHRASAYRTFTTAQDFIGLYRTMEFYLNRRIREGPPDPDLEFYVRFARNAASEEENYYEYRMPVPRDWILQPIDIVELSRLQLTPQDSVSGSTTVQLENGATIKRKGNPSFTSVERISFGVVNVGSTTVVNGSIWVDELRLTSVKRDRGLASRLAVGMGLADFASVNLSYQMVDADFLRIGRERGEGTTRRDISVGTRINAEKFFERWGVRLPVTLSYGRGKQIPKFRTSSDLVLENPRESDITQTLNQDFSFSYSRNRSNDPLLRYTLDAVSLSGRTSKSVMATPDVRDTTLNSTGSLQYSLPLQGGPPLRIYRKTELRLLPTSFAMNLTGGRQTNIEYRRRNADLTQEAYDQSRRLRTKTGSMSWNTGARPIEQVNYTFDQTRDLLLATAPVEILGINIGTETSRRQQLTANEQFPLFKKTIVPKVSWSGNSDLRFSKIQATGGTTERSNSYDNGNSLSISVNLPLDQLARLIPSFGQGNARAPAPGDTTGGRTPERAPTRTVTRGGGGKFFSISPVVATQGFSRSKRLERVGGDPSIAFQLGLSPDPGSGVRPATGFSEGSGNRRDLTMSTDMTVLYDVKVRMTFLNSYNKSTQNRASSTTKLLKFPDLDVNWGRIHQRIGLGRLTKSLTANTRYSRERREFGTSTNPLDRRETNVTMRPFLNLDATLNNGMSAKFTSAYATTNLDQFGLFQNATRSKTRQIGLALRKSLNLTRMVLNPITKKRSKVSSKLDVSLAIDLQDGRRESGPVGKLVLLEDRSRFSISTTAGYSFTSSISGNAGLSMGQDTDRKNRTNTARFVSVTVSAAFNF
jgi:hypothetical protein